MEKKVTSAFSSDMQKTMGGFQSGNPSNIWDMKKFIDPKEWNGLKEQELFYRATNYRGS